MIPSARFGDVRISQVQDNTVNARLFGLYAGASDQVANTNEFCFYLLTDLFWQVSMHANVNWSFKEITKEQAKMCCENVGLDGTKFLREAHALLSDSPRAFPTAQALFADLTGLGAPKEELVRIPPSAPMGTSLTTEGRSRLDQLVQQRLGELGVDHNSNAPIQLRYYPIQVPVTAAGKAHLESLQQRFQLPITDDFMKKFHGGDTIGAETLLGRLGMTLDRFATSGPTLKMDLLDPPAEMQVELISRFHDAARPIVAITPPNEQAYRDLAATVITSVRIAGIEPLNGTYTEQAELQFTVDAPERIAHLIEGLWVSIG